MHPTKLKVVAEQRGQPRAERHQPALAELGAADDQQIPLKVDIGAPEARDLTNAQPEAIEQREDRPVRRAPEPGPRAIRQAAGKLQEPARVSGVKQVGDPVWRRGRVSSGDCGRISRLTSQSKSRRSTPSSSL